MSDRAVWDRIELVRGDITRLSVDAIVNAANNLLLGGGGVDGAIHRAAGLKLKVACAKLLGCRTGSAKITPGFDLPAKYVIHAVGPRYRDGTRGEPEALASCYHQAVQLAADHQCDTLAFPAISCGVYGYPIPDAARVSIQAVAEALINRPLPKTVTWVLYDENTLAAFATALDDLRHPS